jgi:signal transduction histidine kinase
MLLEQKNERLNYFAMTLAHDLRAPLAALTMKLQYIQEREAGRLSERTDELISSGLASMERLIQFIQSLYEHAKLGAVATTMESCSLESIVADVLRDLDVADSDNCELTVDSMPHVWGSRPLLYQLFMNLVGNSLKYSDKLERRICMEAGGIINRSLGRFFQFELKDNGPGIPAGKQADIFSLFKRGESSLPTIEGAGIGLATAKHIVELHGGSIELVESRETSAESEWGANFRIILPLHPVIIGT